MDLQGLSLGSSRRLVFAARTAESSGRRRPGGLRTAAPQMAVLAEPRRRRTGGAPRGAPLHRRAVLGPTFLRWQPHRSLLGADCGSLPAEPASVLELSSPPGTPLAPLSSALSFRATPELVRYLSASPPTFAPSPFQSFPGGSRNLFGGSEKGGSRRMPVAGSERASFSRPCPQTRAGGADRGARPGPPQPEL